MARHKKLLPDETYVDVTIAIEHGTLCQEYIETILKRRDLNDQDSFDLTKAYGFLVALLAPFRKIAELEAEKGKQNGKAISAPARARHSRAYRNDTRR
jgi:hypothetical protein